MPTPQHHRARVARLSRDHAPSAPELVEARRDLKAANLQKAVEKAVNTAPPLTEEQVDRISAILRGGAR